MMKENKQMKLELQMIKNQSEIGGGLSNNGAQGPKSILGAESNILSPKS